MQGVLAGFATLGAIIALGFLLAQFGVLRSDSQLQLTRLAFFVATPALLFQTLSRHRLTRSSHPGWPSLR